MTWHIDKKIIVGFSNEKTSKIFIPNFNPITSRYSKKSTNRRSRIARASRKRTQCWIARTTLYPCSWRTRRAHSRAPRLRPTSWKDKWSCWGERGIDFCQHNHGLFAAHQAKRKFSIVVSWLTNYQDKMMNFGALKHGLFFDNQSKWTIKIKILASEMDQ